MKFYKLLWVVVLLANLLLSLPCEAKTPKLLNHAAGDVTSSFADWPMMILISGVIAASSVHPLDDDVQEYFSTQQFSENLDRIGNWIGNPYILSSTSVLIYGSSLLTNDEEFQKTSETMVEALIFNAVMTEGLKFTFNRTRPNGGNYSFPSGHTSTMFTIASVLQNMEGSKYGIPTYIAAGIVGFSRIDGNYHYLSDVVFGAALGTCIGWGTSMFHKKEGTKLLIFPILDQTRGIMLSYKF